jgi:hypothetical protein
MVLKGGPDSIDVGWNAREASTGLTGDGTVMNVEGSRNRPFVADIAPRGPSITYKAWIARGEDVPVALRPPSSMYGTFIVK